MKRYHRVTKKLLHTYIKQSRDSDGRFERGANLCRLVALH